MKTDGIVFAALLLMLFFVIPALLATPSQRTKSSDKTRIDSTGLTHKKTETALTFTAINKQAK